jgi:hypothetical protein
MMLRIPNCMCVQAYVLDILHIPKIQTEQSARNRLFTSVVQTAIVGDLLRQQHMGWQRLFKLDSC